MIQESFITSVQFMWLVLGNVENKHFSSICNFVLREEFKVEKKIVENSTLWTIPPSSSSVEKYNLI